MENTVTKLIWACYLLIALLAIAIAAVFYQSQSSALRRPMLNAGRQASERPVKPVAMSTALSKRLRFDIERQRERIRELQELLSKREQVLQRQASQLQTQTAESTRLQAEADRYLELLQTLVQESAASIDDNLDVLRGVDSENAGSTEPPTIESLEAALAAAEWELDQSVLASNATEMSLVEQTRRTLLMRNVIVDTGEQAVPVLVSMLSERDSEVRVWAASALAEVGAGSPVAMDALLVAADDDDASVRAAARTAIQDLSEN